MRLAFSIMMILVASWGSPVCDSVVAQTESQPLLAGDINTVTYLDATNVEGSPGLQYWDIISAGTYVLTDSINTDNNYAVRIFASNVIFDGNGKTITGPGIGTYESGPSYYGIRVNSGTLTQNVTVKNVIVKNKGVGVLYEYVQGGAIRSSQFDSNTTGIATWKCSNLNILSNTVYSNTNGIVLDADRSTNDYFTIDSNNVYGNNQFGIMLWLSNNHNVISNNQANYNNMGIVLTDGGTGASGTDNTISNNTVNGNVVGFYIANYHGNRMIGNSLSGNSNAAVSILQSSSGNQFTGNYVLKGCEEDSWCTGMALTVSANGNVFYNNVFKNVNNVYSDGTDFNNQWNITPMAGVNIVGGPSIGGNYWSNPSSTGFSDTQPDSNFDGFCDQPYNPQGGLIDNYPLHKTSVYDAHFTGNTIPSNMVQGQSYPITVTVNNNGTTTWDSNYQLGGVGDSTGDAAKFGPLRIGIPTGTTVAPGQSYTFSFSMTPSAAGTFTPKYQMVQSNWFGQILSKQVIVTPEKITGLPWLLLLLQ